jgi:cation:H+ antiporter
MIFLVVLSTYVIFRASFSFDIAASFLTRKMSAGVKGPTINAIASSLPELLISFLFLFHYNDIVGFSAGYAAIIGSAAFNICIIPCIAAITYFYYSRENSFKLNTTVIIQDSLFNIFSIITLGLIFYFGRITPVNSLVLMVIYSFYIYSVFTFRKTKQVNAYEKVLFKNSTILTNLVHLKIFSLFGNRVNKFNSIIVVLISLILIAFSCHLLTTSCENLSSLFGVNLFYISFFIAAIASSLPDTILSVYDAKKGNYDDAFSNAFGSNIFDVCIGLGLPVFIYTLINGDILINDNPKLSSELLIISLILLLLVSVAIGILFSLGKFNKNKAIITLIIYSLFIFSIMSLK